MNYLRYAATVAVVLTAAPLAANASLMTISLSEPGFTSVTSPSSSTGAIGIPPISFGTFTFNSVSGQDQSALAIPSILNAQSLNISSMTAGVLTIDVKSTGLTGFNQVLGTSSFAVNTLVGSITSVTETTLINGTQLASHSFTGIGTNVQTTPIDLGSGGTFTADDVFVITSIGGVNGNANLTIDLSGTPASTPVPEPASLALLSVGLIGLGLARKRRA